MALRGSRRSVAVVPSFAWINGVFWGYDRIDSADDGDGNDEGVREEEACRPPSPLTFPATTATAAYDHRRQGTNIVRALDGDRLRNRWSSLVEGMHRRELERAEGDARRLDAELSDGGSSVSSASTSSSSEDDASDVGGGGVGRVGRGNEGEEDDDGSMYGRDPRFSFATGS